MQFLSKTVSGGVKNTQNVEDAQMVLLSLGYEKDEVSNAVERALSRIDDNASAEEILKEALKVLSL